MDDGTLSIIECMGSLPNVFKAVDREKKEDGGTFNYLEAGTLIFSDETTFHLSGKVNRHNVRVWGAEFPHVTVELERDSPKVNVFCAISKTKLYGPFFFIEEAVTGPAYLDMLQLWLFPQLTPRLSSFNRTGLHLTGAQLTATFSTENCYIAGLDDVPLLPWPPGRQIWHHVISSCGVM
ncbi:hypothetical protein AVEN_135866-1 [Araneus ventricosus]|uniref:Uncharacterized protein n=1 Tax=Araneus ventricosus TaxID=182803 RepID=A0A4Y2SI91_ARAVE|nr:hypothetical protein AVEN_135866-1 [Araneus ventricosus]